MGWSREAEEETQRVMEWQDLFGKYKAPAFSLPHDRIYHLQTDDPALPESKLTAQTSGLTDLGVPIPKAVQHLCHVGLPQQAVTQDHPLDNSQTEAHGIYDAMVTKYRDALHVVENHVNTKRSWVELMKSSTIDDGPESAVDIHMDDPPAQISSIRTRIKSLATGVWDLLKRLTEYMAPTVVKTPATSVTTTILEPEIDPAEIGLSVPENALITLNHDRRFDWAAFSRNLLIQSLNAPIESKPVIHHKAPAIFTWPENQTWDSMDRIAHRLAIPTPDPWSSSEYMEIAESALQPLSTKVQDNQSAFNNWIWTWAYDDPESG